MNPAISQLQLFPTQTGVLSGGQAPAHWKREVACETDRLAMVLRKCRWVNAVVQIRASLLEQPLLGNCLSEITSGNSSESQVDTTEPIQFKRQSRQPAFSSRGSVAPEAPERPRNMDQFADARESLSPGERLMRSQRGGQSGDDTGSRAQGDEPFRLPVSAESVCQFPVQAGASLLTRLAPPVDVSKQEEKPAKWLTSLPINRPASLSPVSTSSPQHQQDWRRLIANRATKTMLRDWSSAEVSASAPDTPATTPGSDLSDAPLLEPQWAMVPSGQRAAAEILHRLAQQSSVPKVSELTRLEVASANNEKSFSQSSIHVSPTAKYTLRSEEVDPGAKPREGILAARDRSALQETDPGFQAQFHPDAHGGERVRSSEHFAPPSLTPSLPQLLPAVGPGAGTSPIAADAARYSAWRDEVNAQEKDLSLLAAQVKRILDEEARRHGIDV